MIEFVAAGVADGYERTHSGSAQRKAYAVNILKRLNLPTDVAAAIAAAQAAEIEPDERKAFPEFESSPGEAKTISILPGSAGTGADWIAYANSQLESPTERTVVPWIAQRAAEQMKLLGFDENTSPDWASIPIGLHARFKVSGIFLPRAGSVSYERFPADTLSQLPESHPRRLALTIRGKYGPMKVKHQVLVYCVEHPIGKRGLDDLELTNQLKAGGFVKLLRLNGPSYAAFKAAQATALQMGHSEITDVHLVLSTPSKEDAQMMRYTFSVNAARPAWHQPELLALVLQEVHRLGPVSSKNPFRELNDIDFAAAVTKALDAKPNGDAPET